MSSFSFIHAADLHIDSPLEGLGQRPNAPIEQLRNATRRALENLVSLAIAEQVAFVVIAGDLYDGAWRDFHTGIFVRKQLERLADARIRVFLIYGNHDAESVITNPLTLPANVHVFPTASASTVQLEDLRVAIHGHSFATRSVVHNLVPDYPPPVPGRFNIGMLHTNLNGRSGHDTYAPCSEQDLLAKGYDYWALGHIHIPEVVRDGRCWVVYAGNTQGRSVRETGVRGCQLVRVDGALRVTSVEHRCLDVVRWASEEVDLEGVEDGLQVRERVQETVRKAADDGGDRLLVVRLTLVGATCLHDALYRDQERWEAEVRDAAESAAARVWVEKVNPATSPPVDPSEVEGRDEVMRVALESLDQLSLEQDALPSEIQSLLKSLPKPVQSSVHAALDPAHRDSLLADLRSTVMAYLRNAGRKQA